VCVSVDRSVCPESVLWQTADWIRMPFGVVIAVDRGMDVIDRDGNRRRGSGSFGDEFGASN